MIRQKLIPCRTKRKRCNLTRLFIVFCDSKLEEGMQATSLFEASINSMNPSIMGVEASRPSSRSRTSGSVVSHKCSRIFSTDSCHNHTMLLQVRIHEQATIQRTWVIGGSSSLYLLNTAFPFLKISSTEVINVSRGPEDRFRFFSDLSVILWICSAPVN